MLLLFSLWECYFKHSISELMSNVEEHNKQEIDFIFVPVYKFILKFD